MHQTIVLDDQNYKLFFYSDTKIIHHRFEATISEEGLKKTLNTGLDTLIKNNGVKWLSDNRGLDPHSEEETEWVNNVWLPKAIKSGWKYWALVVPDNMDARFNMTDFVQAFFDMGIRVAVFVDFDEAMTWLENVDK